MSARRRRPPRPPPPATISPSTSPTSDSSDAPTSASPPYLLLPDPSPPHLHVPTPISPNGKKGPSSPRPRSGTRRNSQYLTVRVDHHRAHAGDDEDDDDEEEGVDGGVRGMVTGYGSDVCGVVRSVTECEGASADTVYWGWVVLLATWLVVVSGVGSVTGVWQWVWGVEEKVKWPQSIDEEGDRFPIPGHYPAMVILTGVMAWVWVIFAWVGMKYFKHAKIQG